MNFSRSLLLVSVACLAAIFATPGWAAVYVIDNQDATGFSLTGAWSPEPRNTCWNGQEQYESNPTAVGNTATWSFTGLPAGRYYAYASYFGSPNRTSAAAYAFSNGATAVTLNQQPATLDVRAVQGANIVDFRRLGSGSLLVDGSGNLSVTVSDSTSNYLMIDAIRLETAAPDALNVFVCDTVATTWSAAATLSAGWTAETQGHAVGDHYNNAPSASAAFNFSNLPDGEYRISSTWVSHENRTANAIYTLGTSDGSVHVNQEVLAANDTFQGAGWQTISPSVQIFGGTYTVTLTNGDQTGSGSSYLMADAVRLEYLGLRSFEWNVDDNGNWSNSANWLPTGVPNSAGAVALLGTKTTLPRTITLDAPVTVGMLTINNPAASYTLAGANALTLDNSGAVARINVSDTAATSDHAIQAPLVLANNVQVSVNSKLTISGGITETTPSSLQKIGPGVLVLAGVNQYSGGTTVNAGLLRIAAGALPASGDVTIAAGGTLEASGAYADAAAWLAGGRIDMNSAGVLAMVSDAANDLDLSAHGSLWLAALGEVDCSRLITPGISGYRFGGGGGTLTLSAANALSGFNPLYVGNGGGGTFVLAAANDFSGSTTITANILRLAAPDALGAATNPLTVNGGTLDLNGNSIEVGELSGTGGTITDASALGGAVLTVNQLATTTFAGTLTNAEGGSLGLAKVGWGTLTLTGNNSHTGPMTVDEGTLELAGAGGTLGPLGRSSGLTINSGATVLATTINGSNGSTGVPIHINAGGVMTTANNIAVNIIQDSVLTLAGGELASAAPHIDHGSWLLAGRVEVPAGDQTSTMSAANMVLRTADGVVFNVARGTADVDLNVTGTFRNYGGAGNALVKTGDGIMVLSGTNSHGGGTSVNGGALVITSDANLGAAGVTLGGGTLQVPAGFTSTKAFSLAGEGGAVQVDSESATLAGPVSGTGGLTKAGGGELVLRGVLSYTGPTVVDGGTLRLAAGPDSPHQAYRIAPENSTANQFANFSLGYDFQVNAGKQITVAQLGFYDNGADGLANDHLVKITDTTNGSTVYAQRFVPAGTEGTLSDGYRFVDLPTPVVLGQGTYRVWGDAFTGADSNFNGGGVSKMAGPVDVGAGGEVTFLYGGRYGSPNTFPGSGVDQGALMAPYGAASFTYYNAAATVGLLPATTAVSITAGSTLDLTSGDQTIGSLSGPSGASVLLDASRLTVGDASDTEFSGVISGDGGALVKQGGGVLTLSGPNTYTGGATIDGGLLRFTAGALPDTGNILINAGGALEASGPHATFMEWLGSGRIEMSSEGTLALAADEGPISLGSYGTLFLGASGDVSYTGTITPSGSEYRLGGGGSTLTLATSNALTGDKSLLVGGGGGGTVALDAANDFSGWVTIDSSTLRLGHADALGHTPKTMTVNGGVLDLNGFDLEVAELSGFGGVITDNIATAGATTLTVNQASFTEFLGTLTNGADRSLGLVKSGPGTLRLSANNSFTGPVVVNDGTLELNGAGTDPGALGYSSGLTINNGGTVRVTSTNGGGTADSTVPVTVNAGGLMTTGDGVVAHIGALTLAGGELAGGFPHTTYGNWWLDGDVTVTEASAISAAQVVLHKTGGVTFDVGEGLDLAVAANITHAAGSGNALIKTGGGSLSLAGISTYQGGTTVTAGTLAVSQDANLGSGNVAIGAATLRIEPFAAFSTSKAVKLEAAESTIQVEDAATADFGGVMTGSAGLTKTGTGTMVLSGTLLYAGPTIVNGGTLQVLQTADAVHQAYQVDSDKTTGNQAHPGSLGYDIQVAADKRVTVTELGFYDSGLDGLAGAHVVRITDTATGAVIGTATVAAGTDVPLSSGYRFAALDTPITLGSGRYRVWSGTYGTDPDYNIRLAPGPTDAGLEDALTFLPGGYWGVGDVYPGTADGAPVTTMPYPYGAVSFKFTSAGGVLPPTTALRIGPDSILDLSSGSQTVASLADHNPADTAGEEVLLGASTLTVGDDANTTFSGAISGEGGSLVKQGDGTLTLQGVNNYSGGTSVAAGTLEIAAATALPAGGALTIGSGGTVVLSSGLSAAGAQSSGSPQAVPEPGTLLLLTAFAAALLAAARRKNP